MKPGFALNLSHDGIGLLRRTATGWEMLGEVPLDAPDLSERLAGLRTHALAEGELMSKIIIPASQILYTTIAAPGPHAAGRREQIAEALVGVTPYPVEDLIFDWSGHGETVQVAVVARETLREAESFAEDWGFNPVSFVAVPESGSFAGEPWFGLSEAFVAKNEGRVDRDQDPVPLRAAQASFAANAQGAAIATAPEDNPVPADEIAETKANAVEPIDAVLATAPEDTAAPTDESAEAIPEPSDTVEPIDAVLATAPEDTAAPTDESAEAMPEPSDAVEPIDAVLATAPEDTAALTDEIAEAMPDAAKPIDAAILPEVGATPDALTEDPPEPAQEAAAATTEAIEPAEIGVAAEDTDQRPVGQHDAHEHELVAETVEPLTAEGIETAPEAADSVPEMQPTAAPVQATETPEESAVAANPPEPALRALPAADAPPKAESRLRAPALPGVARQTASAVVAGTPQLAAQPRAPSRNAVTEVATRETPHRLLIGLTAGLVAVLLAASLWASLAQEDTPPRNDAASAEVIVPQAPQVVAGLPHTEPPQIVQSAPAPVSEPETVTLAALTTELPPAPEPVAEQPIVLAANEIVPTAQGAVTPQGITLFSGRPPQVPKPRPGSIEQAAKPAEPIAEPQSAKVRPVERPASVTAPAEPVVAEAAPPAEAPAADPTLAGFRPKGRPMAVVSAGETARRAEDESARKAEEAARATEGATEQAVSVSRRPVSRPRNYRQSVEQALAAAIASEPVPAARQPDPAPAPQQQAAVVRQQPAAPAKQAAAQRQVAAPDPTVELDEPEPTLPTKKMPTTASVAKQATQKDALKLREMNLIGLYGAQGSRRALIRMPNGKMIKVGIGDGLDGGRVTAIGDGQLTYQKGSKLYQLKLLQGS